MGGYGSYERMFSYGLNSMYVNGKKYFLIKDVDLGVWYVKSEETGLCSGIFLALSDLIDAVSSDVISWVSEDSVRKVLQEVEFGRVLKGRNICA